MRCAGRITDIYQRSRTETCTPVEPVIALELVYFDTLAIVRRRGLRHREECAVPSGRSLREPWEARVVTASGGAQRLDREPRGIGDVSGAFVIGRASKWTLDALTP